ncbi:cell division protein FtsL [Oceanimonas sp. NS1]|uniref:Cell division protein FtsL n=1 Tax=Oceanimonas doudoroffii TaxID=84158 RepID=A0A233RCN7_9GAMM|nr:MULTISPECIES: cell division protein FtsL [Oceanimonas]MCT7654911.1 cell division protein FtsL [Oceanimonas sp. NS1]NHI01189.1 Cell division protein FtsL [Oceanimonas sp. MB9]OXY81164.1 cell division protein FtsL [Oceanimonas doudoroffii]
MESRINLAREVGRDLWRYKWLLLLAVATVVSAMTVIVVTHGTRQLTSEYNELMAEQDKLDIEWRNLLLEQNTLMEHSRVEALARDKLGMYRPNPGKEKLVMEP